MSNLGISLESLQLLGDFEFPEEDKKLTEKELIKKVLEDKNYKQQKETIEKYVSEFIRADLITQEIHKRRGEELVYTASNGKQNEDWIDGGVFLYRTPEKDSNGNAITINASEYVKVVDETEYVQMQYVTPDEFQKMVDNKDEKIRYRYTLDEDTGEIKIAQVKIVETKKTDITNAVNSIFTAESKEIFVEEIINMDYKQYIEKYTMPYEFLINLCEITQNPEFVYHVAKLARETYIMLVIQDDTTVEDVTTIEENKYQSFENKSSSSMAGATVTSEEIKKIKTEVITTTMVPHLEIEFADTWSFYEEYEYSKTIKQERSTNGPNVIHHPLPDTLPDYHPGTVENVESPYGGYETITSEERWTGGPYLVETITTTETVTTITKYNPGILKNSVEKSKQFLGLLRNSTGKCENTDCYSNSQSAEKCAKDAVFDRNGKNVAYKIPNSTRTETPLNKLTSGEQMLYDLLGASLEGNDSVNASDDAKSEYKTKMSGLIEHMQYLMTLPENEQIVKRRPGPGPQPIPEPEPEPEPVPPSSSYIVKTDEPGALTPVTKEQLIAVITANFSGQTRTNALSIVDTLIRCQDNYKVNAIFVVAFAQIESGIGTANTSHVRNNNWLSWNLGAVYSSPQENVETVMRNIATGSIYFTKGLITIDDIGHKYCPNCDEYPTQGDDWVRNVTAWVKRLYDSLGMGEPDYDVDTYTSSSGRTYKNYKQDSGSPWESNEFAGGTMKSSGCSITSVAIILSGYGNNSTPEDLRVEVGGKVTDLVSLLNRHGISGTRPNRAFSAEEMINHLKTGKPIIVNVKGEWTASTGHYMTLVDYRNNNGRDEVYVLNPGTVNSTKNGWVNISRISNNMKTKSIFITSD